MHYCFKDSFPIVLYVCWVFLYIILELNHKKKQLIKPLNLTWRVKRQLMVMIVLYLIMYGVLMSRLPLHLMGIMLMIAHLSPWVLVYVMSVITEPIENKIKELFMNMAKDILRTCPAKIVGITGSFGKTSSKNILQEILSERYYSLMTPASFNTPMGITITVREKLKPIHEVFGEDLSNLGNMFFIEPLEYLSFVYLMEKSTIVLTDSGGIQELLNFEVTQYTDYVRIFQKNGERQRVWDYLAD